MICKNCNYDLLPNIKDVGPHTGAYCSFCGKWIKWLGKKEKRKYCDKDNKPYPVLTGKSCETIIIDEFNYNDNDDEEVPW